MGKVGSKFKSVSWRSYTHNQKKHKMKSCVSFGEECRYVNFIESSRKLETWTRFFATCQKNRWVYLTRPGSCDLDPEMWGSSRKLFCISFDDECI